MVWLVGVSLSPPVVNTYNSVIPCVVFYEWFFYCSHTTHTHIQYTVVITTSACPDLCPAVGVDTQDEQEAVMVAMSLV